MFQVQLLHPLIFKLLTTCLSNLALTENSTGEVSWETLEEIANEISTKATDIVNLLEQLDPETEVADKKFPGINCKQTPHAIALLILEEWSRRSDSSGRRLFRILSSSSLADHEDFRLLTDQGKNEIYLYSGFGTVIFLNPLNSVYSRRQRSETQAASRQTKGKVDKTSFCRPNRSLSL